MFVYNSIDLSLNYYIIVDERHYYFWQELSDTQTKGAKTTMSNLPGSHSKKPKSNRREVYPQQNRVSLCFKQQQFDRFDLTLIPIIE